MPDKIKPGDQVKITRPPRGYTFEGIVETVNGKDGNWNITVMMDDTGHLVYWEQEVDGGSVELIEHNLIGLSLSACVLDIVKGNIEIENVEKILAGTHCATPMDWYSAISYWVKHDWKKHTVNSLVILCELFETGKIEQPRLVNDAHIPVLSGEHDFTIWVDEESQITWDDDVPEPSRQAPVTMPDNIDDVIERFNGLGHLLNHIAEHCWRNATRHSRTHGTTDKRTRALHAVWKVCNSTAIAVKTMLEE